MKIWLLIITYISSSCTIGLHAFLHPTPRAVGRSYRHAEALSSSLSVDDEPLRALTEKVKSMKVKDIQQELELAGIKTDDVFEKNELVERLVEYRNRQGSLNEKKKEKVLDSCIRVPMEFHSLTPAQSVASKNSNVYLRPSPGKYPSIQLTVPGQRRKLTLLVDTACSGVVLRPGILDLYNLPKMNTGISMTAAGGTTTAGSVAKLISPLMEDGTKLDDMIVAGQDIGALPAILDGIIGLSFLNQFQSVTFDFDHGELMLSKKRSSVESWNDWSHMEVMAKSTMKLCKIGVWTVDATLDGRGPVSMLVDTGAAATFLNWKGVHDLRMDRNHPRIEKNTNALGAMGADNIALQLSHRFVLKSRVNFTSDPTRVGPFEPLGIDLQNKASVNIDIGDLPVLSVLQVDNVGGILGNDILMQCDVLHLDLSRPSSPEMILFHRRKWTEEV